MTSGGDGKSEQDGRGRSLSITLQPEASFMQAGDNREIPFERAFLTIRNVSGTELVGVIPHATLGQEGGTIQDISASLAHSVPASIPPLGVIRWDLYDLLLTAHPGAASKLHMFGYRAALNWRFELACWAEYRLPGLAAPEQTPDAASGDVALAIEEVSV